MTDPQRGVYRGSIVYKS